MNEQIHDEVVLSLFKELESSPESTQRSLSQKLNISLGKTNYLLKALIKRGQISIHNFSLGNGKLNKVKYLLTKEGMETRLNLTRLFLEKKEREYLHIKNEWEKLNLTNSNKQD